MYTLVWTVNLERQKVFTAHMLRRPVKVGDKLSVLM